MWESIVLCTVVGVFILVAYTLGLKNGQKVSKNEDVQLPNINPIAVITKELQNHEEKKKRDAMEIMMSNIDNYDGSGIGQREIP